ncbi:hypothetical protein [Tenacibaculum xiamenense]|uniref:hypothetical protein n=1 Tax=Tenacibaculum xiamenense TaxID=1261553 RepID=UPI0038934CB3
MSNNNIPLYNHTRKETIKGDNFGVAVGALEIGGAGVYELVGGFWDESLGGKRKVCLSSLGVGDVIDAAVSEMEGTFQLDPSDHFGSCRYTLEAAQGEDGPMILTIKTRKGEKIAELKGDSEGFGEAFCENKKGHLYVSPSEHQNIVVIEGDSSLKSLKFELDDHKVTKNQPFDGIHAEDNADNPNTLKIDVKAGRKGSSSCAGFYKDFVDGKTNNMMHTRGGNVKPDKLNFAFTGVLSIEYGNGVVNSYNICLGQGHHGTENNWHFASEDLESAKNHKSGDLGDFHISCDGSYTFKVKRK